jgi:hypothetical protein
MEKNGPLYAFDLHLIPDGFVGETARQTLHRFTYQYADLRAVCLSVASGTAQFAHAISMLCSKYNRVWDATPPAQVHQALEKSVCHSLRDFSCPPFPSRHLLTNTTSNEENIAARQAELAGYLRALWCAGPGDPSWPVLSSAVAHGAFGVPRRDKSGCHFRKAATEYNRKPGIKWFSFTAK